MSLTCRLSLTLLVLKIFSIAPASLSATEAVAHEYSFHFMWINSHLTESDHIFGEKSNEEVHELFQKPLENWRTLHPKAPITLWYDGHTITTPQLDETVKIFSEDSIQFADIRDILALFKNAKDIIDKTKEVPINFRLDLVKAIITYAALKEGGEDVVFADFDVEPIEAVSLFSEEVCELLVNYSFVLAAGPSAHPAVKYENSFMIFRPSVALLSSLKIGIIEANIARMNNLLHRGYWKAVQMKFDRLNQIIWASYEDMASAVFILKGYLSFCATIHDPWSGTKFIARDLSDLERAENFGVESRSGFIVRVNEDTPGPLRRDLKWIPTIEVTVPVSGLVAKR